MDPALHVPCVKLHVLPTFTDVPAFVLTGVRDSFGAAEHVDVLGGTEAVISGTAELTVVVEVVGICDLLTALIISKLWINFFPAVFLFPVAPLWNGWRNGLPELGVVTVFREVGTGVGHTLSVYLYLGFFWVTETDPIGTC